MEVWENFNGRLDFGKSMKPSLDDNYDIIENLSKDEIEHFKSILGRYSFNELDIRENFIINLIILGADKESILKVEKDDSYRLDWENYAMMKIIQIYALLNAERRAKDCLDSEIIQKAIPLS
ncbi:hypothetical protein Hs30E_17980 [Lactococcus hodotermopsidis]|uniref:Uncharacterized protein n=1 Tax=Pseudolactococcus hodotermopsidis TaxID=2709157 RepID=A0A6A0BHH0_9LACT|nr:hypothetical protein [Lactococcus hodotermopsidis]GFH43247.1 hypothetical protein Hs30E_17980 [Lactococcus hodotermopsidis]